MENCVFLWKQARRRGLVLLVGLLLSSSMAWAEPPAAAEPLTLEAAVATARQNSRLIEAARLRIAEARGDLTGAGILLADNPEILVEAGPRVPGGAAGGATAELGVGIEQRFETGGQRGARLDLARAQVDVATANANDVQRVIDLAVARTFYTALAAERRLRLHEDNERLARDLHDIAQRRLDAGAGRPLEVSTARVRLAEAQRRTLAARTGGEAAVVRLAELLGIAPSTRLALRGELPESESAPAADVLVARALARRPDLAAADREIDAAQAALGLADAEAWPDLGVGVFYGREENDDVVTAGIRVPVPLFNRNQGERERARAARQRLAAVRDALALAIESDVRRTLLAYQEALRAFELYDAEVLRAQEESLRLLRGAFEAGEVAVPDVIVVQRELIEGRQGYVDAGLELAHARAALLASIDSPQTAHLQGDQ